MWGTQAKLFQNIFLLSSKTGGKTHTSGKLRSQPLLLAVALQPINHSNPRLSSDLRRESSSLSRFDQDLKTSLSSSLHKLNSEPLFVAKIPLPQPYRHLKGSGRSLENLRLQLFCALFALRPSINLHSPKGRVVRGVGAKRVKVVETERRREESEQKSVLPQGFLLQKKSKGS